MLVATTYYVAEKLEPFCCERCNGRNWPIPTVTQIAVTDIYQYLC